MKTIYTILTSLLLTSCTAQRPLMGTVKKEPQVYWGGVAFFAVSTFVVLNIKFKTQ